MKTRSKIISIQSDDVTAGRLRNAPHGRWTDAVVLVPPANEKVRILG